MRRINHFDPNLLTLTHTRGGADGAHYLVKYNGQCLGHFYEDASDAADLANFIAHFEEEED